MQGAHHCDLGRFQSCGVAFLGDMRYVEVDTPILWGIANPSAT